MNIDTGELRKFSDSKELADFFEGMNPDTREKWVEVDPAKLTTKQIKKMVVESAEHRSPLAVQRDILRKQRRSARRKAARSKHAASDRKGA